MRIARLARLELTEEEIEQHRRDLNQFLASCAKLQEVEVGDTTVGYTIPATQTLRRTSCPVFPGGSIGRGPCVRRIFRVPG